jgi:hypothetical protein
VVVVDVVLVVVDVVVLVVVVDVVLVVVDVVVLVVVVDVVLVVDVVVLVVVVDVVLVVVDVVVVVGQPQVSIGFPWLSVNANPPGLPPPSMMALSALFPFEP